MMPKKMTNLESQSHWQEKKENNKALYVKDDFAKFQKLLLKTYKWGKHEQHWFITGGKTYVFFNTWSAWVLEKWNKVSKLIPSQEMARLIQNTINKKNQPQAPKPRNTVNQSKSKEQGESTYYKELFMSVMNLLSDPDKLQVVLERDADEYQKLVNAPGFQTRVDKSIANNLRTKADIVRIQLLWKFKYGLNTTVDGIRWGECVSVVSMWQLSKQQDALKNKIETDNRGLMKKLYALVKEWNQQKIESELITNASKYSYLVASDWFQGKFEEAKNDPQHNIILIQLYGRFVLQDNTVRVDGVYRADQINAIIGQSLNRGSEKDREERRARYEQTQKISEWDIEQQNSATISKKFMESLTPENKSRYAKILDLSPTVLDSLLQKKEKKQKPETLLAKHERRQHAISEIAIKSATKGCINYLQELFKQPIQIDSEREKFQKALEWLSAWENVETHDQNIDFKVNMWGKEVDLCYNMYSGELNYSPKYFVNDKQTICKNKSWSWAVELPVFKDKKILSIVDLMWKAKSNIESASTKLSDQWTKESVSANRWILRTAVKQIEIPPVDMIQDKLEFAKKIEKEECMQKFVEITGYDLTQDLEKESHKNDQLYILYDTINRTIDAQKTPEDIKHFQDILKKFKDIANKYSNPSEKLPVNMWNTQFSQENIQKFQSNTLWPKQTSGFKESLPFYSLFTQYCNWLLDEQNPQYRVMDTQKIESDFAIYAQYTYLPDLNINKAIANNEQAKDQKEADDMLKNLV